MYHTFHKDFSQSNLAVGFKAVGVLPHDFDVMKILKRCHTIYSEDEYTRIYNLCAEGGPFFEEVVCTGTISEKTFDTNKIPNMSAAAGADKHLALAEKGMVHRRGHLITHSHLLAEKGVRDKKKEEEKQKKEEEKKTAEAKKAKIEEEKKKQVDRLKDTQIALKGSKDETKKAKTEAKEAKSQLKAANIEIAQLKQNKEVGAEGGKKKRKHAKTTEEEEEDEYCIVNCSIGYKWGKGGRTGVQCSKCEKWYHVACIGKTEEDFIDKTTVHNCAECLAE